MIKKREDELREIAPQQQRNPLKTIQRATKKIEELEKENQAQDKIILESQEAIRKAKQVKEANAATMDAAKADLLAAQKEIAETPGVAAPTAQQQPAAGATPVEEERPAAAAATEAVRTLKEEEVKSLHVLIVEAMKGLTTSQAMRGPYEKYVATMQAAGLEFLPPGEWATLMVQKVVTVHEKLGVPLPQQPPPEGENKEAAPSANAAKPAPKATPGKSAASQPKRRTTSRSRSPLRDEAEKQEEPSQ